MFPESHGFVAVPVTSLDNFIFLHLLDMDKLKHVFLIHVTDIAMIFKHANHANQI